MKVRSHWCGHTGSNRAAISFLAAALVCSVAHHDNDKPIGAGHFVQRRVYSKTWYARARQRLKTGAVFVTTKRGAPSSEHAAIRQRLVWDGIASGVCSTASRARNVALRDIVVASMAMSHAAAPALSMPLCRARGRSAPPAAHSALHALLHTRRERVHESTLCDTGIENDYVHSRRTEYDEVPNIR